MPEEPDVAVSDSDPIEIGRSVPAAPRTRVTSEFDAKNQPLPAEEIERRKRMRGDRNESWTPRTLENVHETTPLDNALEQANQSQVAFLKAEEEGETGENLDGTP